MILLNAIECGCIQSIKGILNAKPTRITTTDPHGDTVLHYVASAGDVAVLDLLLESGAKRQINKRGFNGITPLEESIQRSNIEIAIRLIEAGATISDNAMSLAQQTRALPIIIQHAMIQYDRDNKKDGLSRITRYIAKLDDAAKSNLRSQIKLPTHIWSSTSLCFMTQKEEDRAIYGIEKALTPAPAPAQTHNYITY